MTVSEATQVLLLALLPFWMLLAHELGHALVQLAVGGGPVLCVAGRPEWLARIGPLLIATSPRPDSWLDYGGVMLGAPTTARRDVAVIVAGPVAGTAAPIAAFDWVLEGVVPLWLVIPVGAFGLFLCVHQWYALVSARLGTDGYALREALERHRSGPSAPESSGANDLQEQVREMPWLWLGRVPSEDQERFATARASWAKPAEE